MGIRGPCIIIYGSLWRYAVHMCPYIHILIYGSYMHLYELHAVHTWPCMSLYGNVWPHMDHIWQCVSICDSLMAIYGRYVGIMYGHIWPTCGQIISYVIHIWSYVPIEGHIWPICVHKWIIYGVIERIHVHIKQHVAPYMALYG